jgi:hypothetical protein
MFDSSAYLYSYFVIGEPPVGMSPVLSVQDNLTLPSDANPVVDSETPVGAVGAEVALVIANLNEEVVAVFPFASVTVTVRS